MIRKILQVAGNEVLLLAQKKDMPGKEIVALEVDLPPDTYWKIRSLLKEAAYMMTNSHDMLRVADINKKILKEAMPFALTEKDRIWIQDKLGIPS